MGFLNKFLTKYFWNGNMWRKINYPPSWVKKAHEKWKRKLPTHPYNMRKVFVGKTFLYKVKHGQGMQGEAPARWYIKKRKNNQ